MITKVVYDKLLEKYGDVSSWAIWANETPGKPKSNVGDVSVFNTEDLLDKLSTEYILVGLNAAERDNKDSRLWTAFHSNDNKRQHDYKIRYALNGTKLWGSYITDVIKGYEQTDSNKVMKDYFSNEYLRNKTRSEFKEELSIIGGRPTLIAFGTQTYNILMSMKDELDVKDIIKVQHYSAYGKGAWGNKENYRENFLRVVNV